MTKKKRYIVVPRTQGIQQNGIKTGKGQLTFGKKTAQWVDDPAVAKEIDTQYGLKGSGDVWVEQDENLEWHAKHDDGTDGKMAGIHHYTFSGVDMSNIRTVKDNGYVWVKLDGKQKRMKRIEAEQEGYEILPQKRTPRRTNAEARQ